MGWRGYVDHDRRVVFFWSQKAACTTLFRMIADNMETPPDSKLHFHHESRPSHQCRRLIDGRGYRATILVRHPTIRAMSAYFNKFCVYRGRPLPRRPFLEPFAQDLHDRYVTRTGADPDANTMTFEDYLDTVEDLFAHRRAPDRPVNGHWDTQIPPHLAADPGFSYDDVIHVERLGPEMRALTRKLGLRYAGTVENRTPVASADIHDGYLGRVAARDVRGYAFGYANFLSERTIGQIARLYAVDFETFGYRPDPRAPGGPLGPPRLRDRLRHGADIIFGRGA